MEPSYLCTGLPARRFFGILQGCRKCMRRGRYGRKANESSHYPDTEGDPMAEAAERRRTENAYRAVAIVMALFLCLFSSCAGLFMLRNMEHDCCGEGCPLCAAMYDCAKTVQEIGGGILAAVCAVAAALFAVQIISFIISILVFRTPVSRKIRMNN